MWNPLFFFLLPFIGIICAPNGVWMPPSSKNFLYAEALASAIRAKENGMPPGGFLAPGGILPLTPPRSPCMTAGGRSRERGLTYGMLGFFWEAWARGPCPLLLYLLSACPLIIPCSCVPTINSAWVVSMALLGDAHRRST